MRRREKRERERERGEKDCLLEEKLFFSVNKARNVFCVLYI